MKTTIKMILALTLLCGSVMADGNQTSGGRECPPEGCPPPCTENCGSNVTWNDDEQNFEPSVYFDEIAEVIEQAWLAAL